MDKMLRVKYQCLNAGLVKGLCKTITAVMFCAVLVTSGPVHAKQSDLSTTSDMVESSLSISLNAQAITVDNETVLISVSQFGLNNITNIVQRGDASNLSNIIQNGSNNEALITQLGEGNVVNLLQQNDYNYFEIIQDGFDNVANVNQLGEQSFIVHQIGNEMVINITQYKE
jgi:minor curlin subunit